MDAEAWDERYREHELVWGAPPNRWVQHEVGALAPGHAVDLACGEGRNAVWLAGLGWRVTAVDFSRVAIEKARHLAATHDGAGAIDWLCGDATTFESATPADLVLLCYLHLPVAQRLAVLRRSAAALAPGGVLLVIGHDTTNITGGVGGPQDAAVLFTAADVVAELAAIDPALVVERAEAVHRPVEGADRPAIDALIRARRPAPRPDFLTLSG